MRLDHIAFRVADRDKTARFLMDSLGYTYTDDNEFEITLGDGSKARCIALEPPEKRRRGMPWEFMGFLPEPATYHLAPEIFVSDGPPGSVIGDWVAERGGVGGVHHMAYMVDDVEATMNEWISKGYAEFLSEKPLHCEESDPELHQVFTKPSQLTGIIYEFIQRGRHGFCTDNVAGLMDSTKNCK